MSALKCAECWICYLGALAVLAVLLGCGRVVPDDKKRAVLASNQVWTIIGLSDLRAPAWPFTLHVVDFEARRGSEVFARGYLCEAAIDDRGFKEEYTGVEWQGENAVHFWFDAVPPPRQPIPILIQNDGAAPIQWLRLTGIDLLLVLDVAAGGTTEVTTIPAADFTYISVEGQFIGGAPIRMPTTSFSRRVRRINLSVNSKDVRAAGIE